MPTAAVPMTSSREAARGKQEAGGEALPCAPGTAAWHGPEAPGVLCGNRPGRCWQLARAGADLAGPAGSGGGGSHSVTQRPWSLADPSGGALWFCSPGLRALPILYVGEEDGGHRARGGGQQPAPLEWTAPLLQGQHGTSWSVDSVSMGTISW